MGLAVHRHPLIGYVIVVLVETMCCAAGIQQARLYRAPRFSSRLASSSRLLDYSIFMLYYASREMIAASIVAGIASILMNTGVGDGDETADAIVLVSLLSAAAMLEASNVVASSIAASLRIAALLPILVATGLVAARLIYREATGV